MNTTLSSKLFKFDGSRIAEETVGGAAFGSDSDGQLCTLDVSLRTWGGTPENYDNSHKLFGDLFLEHGAFFQRQRGRPIEVRLRDGSWRTVPKAKSFDGFAVSPKARFAFYWGDPLVDLSTSFKRIDLASGKIVQKPIQSTGFGLVRHNGNVVYLDERFVVFLAKPHSFSSTTLSKLPSKRTSLQKGFVDAVVCILDSQSGIYSGCYRVTVEGREFEGGSLDRERVIGRLSDKSCAVLGYTQIVRLDLGDALAKMKSGGLANRNYVQGRD